MKLWGIDLGGTKIECAVIDADRTIIRKRLPTEAAKGYPHIIAQIHKLITEVSAELGEKPRQIGFATPGVLDRETQTMKNCNTVSLNGQPLRRDLEKVLRAEVRLANDANCFALAEALMGAGREHPKSEVIFGIIMGTGVGGGLIVNDKIIEGVHGIAGEWGHNVLEENGESCYCGKRGCVETIISGPALEKHYAKLSGKRLNAKQIVAHYRAGNDDDSAAAATVERLLEYYGRAVATLVNVLDPNLIIIGGGLGNIDLLYTTGAEHIGKYVLNPGKLKTIISKPALGDSAGVFGAALLFAN